MSTARPWVERLCEAMDWGHVEGLDELLDDPPAHAEGGSGEALRDAWRAVGVLRRAVMRGEAVDEVAREALRKAREAGGDEVELRAILAAVGAGAFDTHADGLLDRASFLADELGDAELSLQVQVARATLRHRRFRDSDGTIEALLSAWEAVVPGSATATRVAVILANEHALHGERAQARKWITRALAPTERPPSTYMARARMVAAQLARDAGEPTEAVLAHLDAALQESLGSSEACNLWTLRHEAGDPDALPALAELAAASRRYWPHLLHARVAFECGRPEEALATLQQVEEWNPTVAAFHDVLRAAVGDDHPAPVPVWRVALAARRLARGYSPDRLLEAAQDRAKTPQRAVALWRLRWAQAEHDPSLLPLGATSHIALDALVLDPHPFGSGAQGAIYGGRHLRWPMPVAVKVLHDADATEDLLREAELLRRLDHPNVVQVVEVGRVDAFAVRCSGGSLVEGAPYFAMRRVHGGALADLSPDVAARLSVGQVVREVLAGLQHAHAHGVLHLDVKPANVLVEDGHLVLTDFGVTSFLQGDDTGRIAGTPQYMAPEQWGGRRARLGPWTDVYAAGCLAWWLVTGERPFPAGTLPALRVQHATGPRPSLPEHLADDALQAWFDRILDPDPFRRFGSAWEAAEAFPMEGGQLHRPDGERTVYQTTAHPVIDPESLAPFDAAPQPGAPPPLERPRRAARPGTHVAVRPSPWTQDLPGWQAQMEALWAAFVHAATARRVRAVRVEARGGVGWDVLGRALRFAVRSVGAEALAVDGSKGGPRAVALALAAALRRVGVGTSSLRDVLRQRAPSMLDASDALQLAAEGRGSRADAVWVGRLLRQLWGPGPAVVTVTGVGADARPHVQALCAAIGPPLVEVTDDPARRADQLLALRAWSDEELNALLEATVALDHRASRQLVEVSRGDPDTALAVLRRAVDVGTLVEGPRRLELAAGAAIQHRRSDWARPRVEALRAEAPDAHRAGLAAWLAGRAVDDARLVAAVDAHGLDARGPWEARGLLGNDGRVVPACAAVLTEHVHELGDVPWIAGLLAVAEGPAMKAGVLRRLGRDREAGDHLLDAAMAAYTTAELERVPQLLDEALACYAEAHAGVLSPVYWLLRAVTMRIQGERGAAAACLRRAHTPELEPFVWMEQSHLAVLANQADEAEEHALAVLAHPAATPDLVAGASISLAELARLRGRPGDARAYYEAAAASHAALGELAEVALLSMDARPVPGRDWFGRAEALAARGRDRTRRELALLRCWAHAVHDDPDTAEALLPEVDPPLRAVAQMFVAIGRGDRRQMHALVSGPHQASLERRPWYPQLLAWLEVDGDRDAFHEALDRVRKLAATYRGTWVLKRALADAAGTREAQLQELVRFLEAPG